MPTLTDLSPLARRLLRAIVARLDKLAATDLYNLPPDRREAGRIRMATDDAKAGQLRLDLADLLGHVPDGAERRAAQRAIEALAVAGWIRRVGTEVRTTHVRLLRRP